MGTLTHWDDLSHDSDDSKEMDYLMRYSRLFLGKYHLSSDTFCPEPILGSTSTRRFTSHKVSGIGHVDL